MDMLYIFTHMHMNVPFWKHQIEFSLSQNFLGQDHDSGIDISDIVPQDVSTTLERFTLYVDAYVYQYVYFYASISVKHKQ